MLQSGCFIIQLPRRVLRVCWLGYLPGSVLQERAAGANSLVCTGLNAVVEEAHNVPAALSKLMDLCVCLNCLRYH